MRAVHVCAAVVAVSAGMSASLAQTTLITSTFNNLSARYIASSANFSATAQNFDPVTSYGGVTATQIPGATTNFGVPSSPGNPATGFLGNGSSNFVLSLNASGFSGSVTMGGLRANGFGTFAITDPDGDQLTGNIVGAVVDGLGWNQVFTTLFYSGFLQNVAFVQRPGGTDTIWNGPNGGSFDWTQVGASTFNGSIVTLNFLPSMAPFNTSGDWGYNGSNAATAIPLQASLQLIPAPGAAGLLGLAGLVAARRRRA